MRYKHRKECALPHGFYSTTIAASDQHALQRRPHPCRQSRAGDGCFCTKARPCKTRIPGARAATGRPPGIREQGASQAVSLRLF